MMYGNGNGNGYGNGNGNGAVTYTEVRRWARWLGAFTPTDLAEALRVHRDVAARMVTALLYHGTCEDTGELDELGGAPEPIIGYVPLPPGPTEHPTGPLPEHIAVREMGGLLLFDRRGTPVRLIDNTERRNAMQGTGGARIRIKQRDKAYEAMQQAKMDRIEADRQKRIRLASQGKLPVKKKKPKVRWPDPEGSVAA